MKAILLFKTIIFSLFFYGIFLLSINVSYGATKNIRFTVDLSKLVSQKAFNPADEQTGINMTLIQNKINVLKVHILHFTTPAFTNFKYSFKKITEAEYETQKPSNSLPFDVGFVAADGTINVSEPSTISQKEVFADINKAAIYYLCQSYISFFYQTSEMPLLFKVGFPAFEAGLNIPDSTVTTAIKKYGGSFASFDDLNNVTTFNANNGIAVAFAFAEFMNVFKNWGYPEIFSINASGFVVNSSWWSAKSNDDLLADFSRYLNVRFLETNEKLRVKLFKETEHFKFYTRETDGINFPSFTDVLEPAFNEYTINFNVKAYEKLTFFTLPECIDAQIEGIECGNRLTSGTAWSSGLHSSCAVTIDQLPYFIGQNRHELGHAFQGLMPQGQVTAWLNEGFAFFCDGAPFNSDFSNSGLGTDYWRQLGISSLKKGTEFFGHRPTYEDTKIYPETDYGYKYLGYFLNDFIYRKGGYQALKDVQMGDLSGYQKLGYSSGQSFMDDFYFDFDVRVQNIPMLTLKTPITDNYLTSPQVNISWTPLKADVKFNVLVSTDNKANWTEVVSKTTQTSCDWNAGTFKGKFFLKFVAPENLDVECIFGPFVMTDPSSLSIVFPNGGEYLIAGDTVSISWAKTIVPTIKLEFSDNNGTTWNLIQNNIATSPQFCKWVVPNIVSTQCKVRISDSSNATKSDSSEKVFTTLKSNPVGGPYLFDKNTVLLMHFDNDLKNRSNQSGDGKGLIENITFDLAVSSALGNCFSSVFPVTVPHTANLNLTGDWTIEAWVKAKAFNNTWMYIVSKPGDLDVTQANYALYINPYQKNSFFALTYLDASNRFSFPTMTPTLNEWYHVAYIRDTKKSEFRILVHDKNRTLIASQPVKYPGSGALLNSKDLLIGSGFNGYIDEVRISNVVRNFDVPSVPMTTYPKDLTKDVKSDANLSWINGSNSPTIDLYFGTENPPTNKILNNVSAVSLYNPGVLLYDKTYYWQVVARNSDLVTNSPVWSFTTEKDPATIAPTSPSLPKPQDSAAEVALDTSLSWVNGSNSPTIDLYFGTVNPPSTKVLDNVAAVNSFDPGELLADTTYYWQVVAKNSSSFASSPVWSFSTKNITASKPLQNEQLPTIFPNPTKGIIYLNWDNIQDQSIGVRIYNINGNPIFNKWILPAVNKFIDLSHCPKGIYLVQLIVNDQIYIKRLIIQ